MFEFMDLIVAPLTEMNPYRYLADSKYRSRKDREIGRRAHRILAYQLFVILVLCPILVVGIAMVASK